MVKDVYKMTSLEEILEELGKPDCTDRIKISSDYHLFREYRRKFKETGLCTGGHKDFLTKRTEKVIKTHNQFVSPDDIFVFLGDCTDDQLFNDPEMKYDHPEAERLFKMAQNIYKNKLNGAIKILLVGNNDPLPDANYIKDFGFTYVLHEPVTIGSHVFMHDPLAGGNIPKDKIGIHGHIHLGATYYNVDWQRHINVCIDKNGRPMTMKEYYDLYKKGFYKSVSYYGTDEEIQAQQDAYKLKMYGKDK